MDRGLNYGTCRVGSCDLVLLILVLPLRITGLEPDIGRVGAGHASYLYAQR
jgi:hypothetical protein